MISCIARQPIFDSHCHVVAYELLYRDSGETSIANFVDGNAATRCVLSDAFTLFGLSQLTDSKPAFINFTGELILEDFALLAKPEELVIEILEDAVVVDQLIEKLQALKTQGYRLALDDYTGDKAFDPILPLLDILKVDFMLTDPQTQQRIAERAKCYRSLTLLAEKVETLEGFERAKALGYRMFQGYFFSKPIIQKKALPSLSASTYGQLLCELSRGSRVDLKKCAAIISTDTTMTYMLMRITKTVRYYRGNTIANIGQALVMIGINEVRRICLLALARQNNISYSDELVRMAYLRGLFAKSLLEDITGYQDSEYGFILGMFSMLDQILGQPMDDVLEGLPLPTDIVQALKSEEENIYYQLLQFIQVYETGNECLYSVGIEAQLKHSRVAHLYLSSVQAADRVFDISL